MTAVATTAPHPMTRTGLTTPGGAGRLSRLRSAAAVGGLAVLLSGSMVGHLQPAASVSSVATSVATFSTGLGITSVTKDLSAVARTGGGR